MSRAFVNEDNLVEDVPDRPISPHVNYVTSNGLKAIDAAVDAAHRAFREAAGEAVQFGSTVTFLRDDGRRQTFRIVGEDEADPSRGTVSYVSPLAKVLLGRKVGDVVPAATGEVEIVKIG
jgi:GreA/GreB family transcription elongation factor